MGGRSYSAFLNGDAMGKSLQGAGGALVAGSVFHALIERTLMQAEFQNFSPEFWLNYAWRDLQKVFETFDGSMLVSAILGLVDNENGSVFFINAEHPFAILFREGKALFVEQNSGLRKLGMPGLEQEAMVQTVALRDGDFLILGSDGKDDLWIMTPGGKDKRIMNEDDSLILRIVEEEGGGLPGIYSNLQKRGELSDDLSLIRIAFSTPEESPTVNGAFLREVDGLIEAGKYEQALNIINDSLISETSPLESRSILCVYKLKRDDLVLKRAPVFLDFFPFQHHILYIYGDVLRRKGRSQDAIQVFERIRIRKGAAKDLREKSDLQLERLRS